MSPAPHHNTNAAGRRVNRDRIKVALSLSERNGLLDLAVEYLFRQGVEPTEEHIRQHVSGWFYFQYGEWLKRQVETDDSAIIL